MKKSYRNFFAILFIAIVSLQCNNSKTEKQEYKTGLILATTAKYNRIAPAELLFGAGENLPTSLDLSAYMPEVRDQGPQMSCVAWATCYALKSFEEKKENNATVYFSPSFVYNQINHGMDKGSLFEDALNLLSQQGASLWDDMPYIQTDYTRQPTEEIKQRAKPYTIRVWRRINAVDTKEVKMHLNTGFPVVIGAQLDEGFRSAKKNASGEFIWDKNTSGGKYIGDHAMVVVGFDDNKNAFKVMNSWGPNWGNNGYCWIDYQLFEEKVKEGYIVFDKPSKPQETKPDNTIIENKPVDNTVIDNKPIIEDYSQFAKAKFENIKVLHNQNHPQFGNCMKITGIVDIPKGIGKTFQFSVHFYYSNTTTQVGSLQSPQFADVNGYAATGTILYSVPDEGLNNWAFEIYMPYTAFNVQTGSYVNGKYQQMRTSLYATP